MSNDCTDIVLEADYLGFKIVLFENHTLGTAQIKAFANNKAKFEISLEDSLPEYIQTAVTEMKKQIKSSAS